MKTHYCNVGSAALREDGPLIELRVGAPCISDRDYELLQAESCAATLKIDTGSFATALSPEILNTIVGSQHVGSTLITTPGGNQEVDVYLVSLWCGGRLIDSHCYVMSIRTQKDGLLGRDILESCTMRYNGPEGKWELSTTLPIKLTADFPFWFESTD